MPGAGMTLHEYHVARMSGAVRAPEMIESHLVERRRRGVARDVAAVLGARPVGLHHHGERVPAHVGLVAQLERTVARVIGLLGPRDRVEIRGVRLEGQIRTGPAREVDQFLEQKMRSGRTLGMHDRLDRLEPLLRLRGVDVFVRRLLRHRWIPWPGGTRPCRCPRVLLRWPTRYSAPAPCERAHYLRGLVFLGQAKGYSRFVCPSTPCWSRSGKSPHGCRPPSSLDIPPQSSSCR